MAQIPRSRTQTATRTRTRTGVASGGGEWSSLFLSLSLVFDGASLRVSRRPRCSPLHRSLDASVFLVPRPREPVRCVRTHYARVMYSRADADNAWCTYTYEVPTIVGERRPMFWRCGRSPCKRISRCPELDYFERPSRSIPTGLSCLPSRNLASYFSVKVIVWFDIDLSYE